MSKTENPIVTVKMASFKVTVAGEVKSPGVFNVDQEKSVLLRLWQELVTLQFMVSAEMCC